VLGLYKALHVLFSNSEQADSWIDRPARDSPQGEIKDFLFLLIIYN
jgi:hypothetical protein